MHASGLQQCGSVHACPPCAAKIRAQRAEEISHKASAHLEAGGGLCFLTVTLPHDLADSLTDLWDVVADTWTTVIGGSPFHGTGQRVGAKERFGIVGFIRAFDLTHGESGWHPHLHILVFTHKPVTELDDDFWALRKWFRNRWTQRIAAVTGREVSTQFGIAMESVKNNSGIGTYISKVNLEMARGDLKQARAADSRTPFQILADAIEHDVPEDHGLWLEYVTASKNRQLITTTNNLKHLYPTAQELSDEEIASAEQDGEVELLVDRHVWRDMVDRDDNLVHQFLQAHQNYGVNQAFRTLQTLTGLRLDTSGDIPRITQTRSRRTT